LGTVKKIKEEKRVKLTAGLIFRRWKFRKNKKGLTQSEMKEQWNSDKSSHGTKKGHRGHAQKKRAERGPKDPERLRISIQFIKKSDREEEKKNRRRWKQKRPRRFLTGEGQRT